MTTYGTTSPKPPPEERDLVLVAGRHRLGEPDQQAAHQGAARGVEAPEDGRGQRAEGHRGDRRRDPRCRRPTAKRPATAASTPAIIQANIETRPRWMPIRAAASPSSAAARMEMPQLEYLNITKNAAISTAATPMASARFVVMPTPPSEIDCPPRGDRR